MKTNGGIMVTSAIKRSLVIGALLLSSFSLAYGMSYPSLSDFYKTAGGASVLPFAKFPGKTQKYFIVGREAGGADVGTYDAFGGSKDTGEAHPLQTAAREFAEETVDLFGNKKAIEQHIDINNNNTDIIVANQNKKSVVYVTQFDHQLVRNFKQHFYNARNNAKSYKQREKDSIAIVREDRLRDAIANAKRNAAGKLITPIIVKDAMVVDATGKEHKHDIHLRPVFVSSMQSYFQGKAADQKGKDPKIHFYNK